MLPEDRGAAVADGIRLGQSGADFDDEVGGGRSVKQSIGRVAFPRLSAHERQR
jgi:hypothetical protein